MQCGLRPTSDCPRKRNFTPIRRIVACNQVEHRGFARPVGTDDAHDAALLHGEGDVIDRHKTAKGLGHAGKIQQIAHDAPLPPSGFASVPSSGPFSADPPAGHVSAAPERREAKKPLTSYRRGAGQGCPGVLMIIMIIRARPNTSMRACAKSRNISGRPNTRKAPENHAGKTASRPG